MAVAWNREVTAKQGFLMYYSDKDAVGTKVSGRYSHRVSGVAVKRSSTVFPVLFLSLHLQTLINNLSCSRVIRIIKALVRPTS